MDYFDAKADVLSWKHKTNSTAVIRFVKKNIQRHPNKERKDNSEYREKLQFPHVVPA